MSENVWDGSQKCSLIQICKEEPEQQLRDLPILTFYEPDYSQKETVKIEFPISSMQIFWKEFSIQDSKTSFAFETKNSLEINKNKTAYEIFVDTNLHNPEFQGKYVVFVDEQLEGVAENERELVRQIHEKYGNIDMYVGKVSVEKTIGMIESPEM